MSLKWDYANHAVNKIILAYTCRVIIKCPHPPPARAQYAPRYPDPIRFVTKKQLGTDDSSDELISEDKQLFQHIIGYLLHCRKMIDCTILVAINDLFIVYEGNTRF